ncbi:hypothetical protein [Paenibacillus sp. LjRoot56]|uniref:hypothetical protein n=1 Tax=Paenibacillus sp. LjRoot56 TaxID=3342333 RepID=UPI003ECF7B95
MRKDSPAINAGSLITSNGGRDYFGASVSSTNVPNIGADNTYNSASSAIIVDNGTTGYSELSGTFGDSSLFGLTIHQRDIPLHLVQV